MLNLNISHVVNCTEDTEDCFTDMIKYYHVKVPDKPDAVIDTYFDGACDFINEAKKEGTNVLVHCTMGMSRSCAVVLAYLMKCEGMRLSQALIHTKERRPVASPNIGFMRQLIKLEEELYQSVSIDAEKYSQSRFGNVSEFLK